MGDERHFALLDRLMETTAEARLQVLRNMPAPAFRGLAEAWFWKAHGGQREPAAGAGSGPGEWRVWLLMAGRGFGKTRAGAEWVMARVRETPGAQIALVGGNLDEVAKVMATGRSGLVRVAGTGETPVWTAARRTLDFPCGAKAFAYSAERPDSLRGPEHHFAWCDELAKWRHADATWDNLALGLRLGERPRVLVTTTPRPVPLLRRIRGLDRLVETRGRSSDNVHSSRDALAAAIAAYAGTRLGRQELDGELIEDVEGALWTRDLIEKARVAAVAGGRPLKRVVVGVDPPASADGDACGIVVCGLAEDGTAYVLADSSVAGLRPDGWARAVAKAAAVWEADRVVAEKNQGGDMVESVLRSVDSALPVRLVSASRGKAARAEPVAARFESGKAKLAGRFPELEDELAGLTLGGGYEGPGRSPDRADALVWAMTELIRPPAAEPRIRML